MENELGRFRKRHSLSQREAAELVGVGLSTWQQLERGFRDRRPSLQLIRHLEALDVIAVKGLPWPSHTGENHGDDDQG